MLIFGRSSCRYWAPRGGEGEEEFEPDRFLLTARTRLGASDLECELSCDDLTLLAARRLSAEDDEVCVEDGVLDEAAEFVDDLKTGTGCGLIRFSGELAVESTSTVISFCLLFITVCHFSFCLDVV
jgi:hypothetical protein